MASAAGNRSPRNRGGNSESVWVRAGGEGRGREEREEERFASGGPSAVEPSQAAVPAAAKPPTLELPRVSATVALRVIDAAANRAREGLRVIEDYVRFVLDDRHLTGFCKQLRHDLTDALSSDFADDLLAARETQADVGTALTSSAENAATRRPACWGLTSPACRRRFAVWRSSASWK